MRQARLTVFHVEVAPSPYAGAGGKHPSGGFRHTVPGSKMKQCLGTSGMILVLRFLHDFYQAASYRTRHFLYTMRHRVTSSALMAFVGFIDRRMSPEFRLGDRYFGTVI